MSASTLEPELYHLDQTLHVPNSHRPVLVYRDALPHPLNSETAQAFLEHNQWKKGVSLITLGPADSPHRYLIPS